MEETEILAKGSQIARAMAPSITTAFGTWLSGGQARKNLEADRAFVGEMLQAGLTDIRYRGIAMELNAFSDANQEEVKRLVTNTVNAMLKADSVVDWSKVILEKFNPEFRRRWIMEASNVSDETLQNLWARLLAGELESPGSVSNDAMSIARDLNKQRAEEFQTYCSAVLCQVDGTPIIVVGCGNPGDNTLEHYGLSYAVLMRLAHHRLIVNDMSSYITVNAGLAPNGIGVRQHEQTWLLRRSGEKENTDRQHRVKGVLLTPAGEELFAVVQKTPNPEYRRAMLTTLEQDGWKAIPIYADS